MNILMTGATGLVGTAVVRAFTAEGHTIYRLTRAETSKTSAKVARVFDMPWNPSTGDIGGSVGPSSLPVAANVDALINLGLAHWRTGQLEAAKATLVQAVARHSKSTVVRCYQDVVVLVFKNLVAELVEL